jgi:hypothetical protein
MRFAPLLLLLPLAACTRGPIDESCSQASTLLDSSSGVGAGAQYAAPEMT